MSNVWARWAASDLTLDFTFTVSPRLIDTMFGRSLALALLLPTLAMPVDFPEARLNNGVLSASLYLPDRDRGYYRGARFDWSGVISELLYNGHSFFGVWFPHYEPHLHDAITGPVEEFRSSDGALGFGEAKPGDLFIKIGVGLLQRPDSEAYQFYRDYQIAGTGQWVVRPEPDRVEFEQELKGVRGWSYRYRKTVRLLRGKPQMVIEHELKNTGRRSIDTEVYNHQFYMLDKTPTGPDMQVSLRFAPQATKTTGGVAIDGKMLHFDRELRPTSDSATATITGYSDDPRDNNISVENRRTGAFVRAEINRPISKLALWSIRTTVCPEAYIALHIEPGKTEHWRVLYTFGAGR